MTILKFPWKNLQRSFTTSQLKSYKNTLVVLDLMYETAFKEDKKSQSEARLLLVYMIPLLCYSINV